jgi:hypothetical protein
MKLLSFSAVAGMAVSAAEEVRLSSSSRRLVGMMTKDLEVATKRFVQENLGKITMLKNPSSGGRRTLRNQASGNWNQASGKSGKMSGPSGKSGKMSGKSGKSDHGDEEVSECVDQLQFGALSITSFFQ